MRGFVISSERTAAGLRSIGTQATHSQEAGVRGHGSVAAGRGDLGKACWNANLSDPGQAVSGCARSVPVPRAILNAGGKLCGALQHAECAACAAVSISLLGVLLCCSRGGADRTAAPVGPAGPQQSQHRPRRPASRPSPWWSRLPRRGWHRPWPGGYLHSASADGGQNARRAGTHGGAYLHPAPRAPCPGSGRNCVPGHGQVDCQTSRDTASAALRGMCR